MLPLGCESVWHILGHDSRDSTPRHLPFPNNSQKILKSTHLHKLGLIPELHRWDVLILLYCGFDARESYTGIVYRQVLILSLV